MLQMVESRMKALGRLGRLAAAMNIPARDRLGGKGGHPIWTDCVQQTEEEWDCELCPEDRGRQLGKAALWVQGGAMYATGAASVTFLRKLKRDRGQSVPDTTSERTEINKRVDGSDRQVEVGQWSGSVEALNTSVFIGGGSLTGLKLRF
ncbi:unnamed protein product [Hydatigera taeniaeformis]|uniref:RING/FYVE/PHD zinc finger superfamily protein n=1 Tax=Hydatigena taeniaeformis TaxID=6205 RepID=A0A0R3X4K4_HYDTA|nr:unnamed protein product [Hydatigera taeniaeformis]